MGSGIPAESLGCGLKPFVYSIGSKDCLIALPRAVIASRCDIYFAGPTRSNLHLNGKTICRGDTVIRGESGIPARSLAPAADLPLAAAAAELALAK